MQIILHKVNTTQQLKLVGKKYGVEVDIRTYGDELILTMILFNVVKAYVIG